MQRNATYSPGWSAETIMERPETPARCQKCQDLGAWLTPKGLIAECPDLQLGFNDHEPLSDAAKAIVRAGRQLAHRGIIANELSFRVARMLARFDTNVPATREEILHAHFGWARTTKLRMLAHHVEELRSLWLLPVGSRKSPPHGYWIITDEADFKEWVKGATSAPIKQLTTIHAVARANFPVFAEQLELDFWTDMREDYAPSEISEVPR